MKIITERTLIADVAQRWAAQYPLEKKGIGDALRRLDPAKATATEVSKIIGNLSWTTPPPYSSWTTPPPCSECAITADLVIQIGEEPDYESCTAWLCRDCVSNAFSLVGGQK